MLTHANDNLLRGRFTRMRCLRLTNVYNKVKTVLRG